jgi:putative ABC transport system permease protein
MQRDILAKIEQLPGVESAAIANSVPLDRTLSADLLYREDKTYVDGETPPVRRFKSVAPGFFKTIGNRIIAGRDLEWTDLDNRRPVVLVSENLAREFWNDPGAALGKRIRTDQLSPWFEIVGVTGNISDNGVHETAPGIVFWPIIVSVPPREDFITRGVVYAIRSSRAGSEGLLKELREAVWSVNRNLPVVAVRTMEDIYGSSMARSSFMLAMLAMAGGMAFMLGIIGVYGVMSYAVSERRREIGVRMALGARNGAVKWLFVRHALVLAAVGAGVGIAVAIFLSELLSSLLFGVSAVDPLTYTSVAVGLIIAAVTASYLPARRACNVNPIEALRSE